MPPPLQSTDGSRLVGVLLAGTALTLAGVGLATNAQFAASLGQTPVASSLLAALGVAIDALALILPCTRDRTVARPASPRQRRRLGGVGWCCDRDADRCGRFAAGNIGDSVTARVAKVAERAELTAPHRDPPGAPQGSYCGCGARRAAECVKVGPICRQRETTLAAVLADPETDLKAAVATLAALPPVVAEIRWRDDIAWSDGAISATAVHRVRIAGLT